jgi:hypothetical protein
VYHPLFWYRANSSMLDSNRPFPNSCSDSSSTFAAYFRLSTLITLIQAPEKNNSRQGGTLMYTQKTKYNYGPRVEVSLKLRWHLNNSYSNKGRHARLGSGSSFSPWIDITQRAISSTIVGGVDCATHPHTNTILDCG